MVEREHEPDRRQNARITHVAGEGGRLISGEQAVELGQLTSLALPSHPAALAGVPQPLAMQQMKSCPGSGQASIQEMRTDKKSEVNGLAKWCARLL